MSETPDYIRTAPSWTGSTFVPTLHREVPADLNPLLQHLTAPFVAVITGASKGIGAATAKAFAQAGATGLILTARTLEALQQTHDECKAMATSPNLIISLLKADNAAESSALEVADTILNKHDGRLDLLVNNAGILGTNNSAFGKLADIDSSQIEIPVQVNYLGRFYMIKHLLPLMLRGESPTRTIINISSIGSHLPGPLGYSLTALATNRLSERVADAYADQGVLCYALHPGAVDSDPTGEDKPWVSTHLRSISKDSIDLCGAFILWLLKEKRTWLSGRYLDATWDVKELEKKKDEIVAGDKLKMRMVV